MKYKTLIKDGIFAAIVIYILFLLYTVITKDFSLESVKESVFFFFLFAKAPFISIMHSIYALLPLIIILGLLYLIITKSPVQHRKYAFVASLIVWQVYGIFSLVFVTGGA